jgi:hypothetical protein
MFLNNSSMTRLPPSLLPGPTGLARLLSCGTIRQLRLPMRFLRHLVSSLAPRYLGLIFILRFAGAGKSPLRRQGVVRPVSPSTPVCPSQGRFRISQVPREPHCAFALFLDSAGALMPSLRGISVLPPHRSTRRASRIWCFRSSITQL